MKNINMTKNDQLIKCAKSPCDLLNGCHSSTNQAESNIFLLEKGD